MSHLSHYNRRAVLISTDKESGKEKQAPLKTCGHCGLVWAPQPGSGRLIGFCQNCMTDLCGRPSCVATGCVHREKQIELMERGIAYEAAPVSVSVPAAPPRG